MGVGGGLVSIRGGTDPDRGPLATQRGVQRRPRGASGGEKGQVGRKGGCAVPSGLQRGSEVARREGVGAEDEGARMAVRVSGRGKPKRHAAGVAILFRSRRTVPAASAFSAKKRSSLTV